ncbi:hypothetical protein HJG60_010374 [Phyllostomus discolor]|uniref:Uncharacterized protein n=1 Tax=Phyllostomus discolor TaxID=89673 RepID=A0A834AT17_9CHIR|nr:hypothetical protein HJG60_010374 [Phyllostomus discolor]
MWLKVTHKDMVEMFAGAWVDLEGMTLSEMLVRERQTPYDFTYMWNLQNTESGQTEQNGLTDTESGLTRGRGRRTQGWAKEGKGPRSGNWQLQSGHRAVKCSMGNVVRNVVITCAAPGGAGNAGGSTW